MKDIIVRCISIGLCVLMVMVSVCGCAAGSAETPAETAEETMVQAAEAETEAVQEAEPAAAEKAEAADDNELTANQEALIAALVKEADERVGNAGKPTIPGTTISLSSQAKDYPETFDLRAVDTDGDGVTENYVTSVKEQHPFGTCWAFASIAAAESSILFDKKQDATVIAEDGKRKDSIDLSEHHLAWFAYTPLPDGDEQAGEGLYSQKEGVEENPSQRMNSGSTQFAASSVFASGMGPVAEPDFYESVWPESALNYHGKNFETEVNKTSKFEQYSENDDWSIDESLRFKQTYMLQDIYYLPSPVSIDEDDNYDFDYAETVIKAYKEQLMNGRAVSISYHADNFYPGRESAAPQYINVPGKTWAHYCYNHVRANHAVTMVGWDDNYPASNFLTEVQDRDEKGNLLTNEDGTPKMITVSQPERNGAWIVKNSWGSTDPIADGLNYNEWGVDGTGYFYLSYWDKSMEASQCFDFDVENKLKADLGEYVLEEYDLLPVEYPHSVTTDFGVATANAFTAEADMQVKAVSCTTTKANEKVSCRIFVLPEGEEFAPEKLELISEEEKEFPSAGLHVVELSKPFDVKLNQRFVICMMQQTDDGYVFSVGSEYNKKGFDAGYCDDRYAAKAVVNPGESFVYMSEDNTWWDFAEVKSMLEGMDGSTSYLTYDNFPIKAYASLIGE